jgi:hypothetical protein
MTDAGLAIQVTGGGDLYIQFARIRFTRMQDQIAIAFVKPIGSGRIQPAAFQEILRKIELAFGIGGQFRHGVILQEKGVVSRIILYTGG